MGEWRAMAIGLINTTAHLATGGVGKSPRLEQNRERISILNIYVFTMGVLSCSSNVTMAELDRGYF